MSDQGVLQTTTQLAPSAQPQAAFFAFFSSFCCVVRVYSAAVTQPTADTVTAIG